MQQTTTSERWASFVSLEWYDGVISFLFRFVAKTSEPLLAAGVIVSAADFLQKGALMAHNPTLSTAWAWCQALAIEASTGPVLVFALQAFRARDLVKGWLYAILAALLFIVGGAMLLLQLVSSVTGLSEASINIVVLYVLFVLRVIVSGGMVALSCTKHLRFSGLMANDQADQTTVPATVPTLEELIERLDERYAQRMQTTIETITDTIIERTIERVTIAQLPQVAESREPSFITSGTETGTSSLERESLEGVDGSDVESRLVQAYKHLSIQGRVTVEALRLVAKCRKVTASEWLKKQLESERVA